MSLSPEDRLSLVDFLPDPERAPNRWAQLVRDLRAPAPMSHWATRVTAVRIHKYDRIRTFLTRGVLLCALAVLLGFAPGTRPLTWALLSVGVVQTLLELHLDGRVNDQTGRRLSPTRLLLTWQDNWQWERTLFNATGLLGGIAVPANIIAVLFLTGPGDPAWVKVAALGVAVAYGNSGIICVLTDGTYYSANQSLPRFLVVLRPYLWLLFAAALATAVGLSVLLDRWHPTMVPLAWAACALTYPLGMKMRDYDRFLRAGGEEAAVAMTEARRRLAQDFHDTLNDIRTLSRALARDDTVSAEHKIDAADLAPKLTLVKEMVDESAWDAQDREITMKGIVEQLGRDHSLRTTAVLELGQLRPENRVLVRQLITTIVTNAGQAMAGRQIHDRPVSVAGHVADGMIHIRIRDPLPLVPPTAWCPDGSTLAVMRERLRRLGGDITQTAVADGKEIHSVWKVRPPRLKRESAR